MFSEKPDKKIPKTLEECYQSNNITDQLWTSAKRLKAIGTLICVAIAIIGVILSIILSIKVETLQWGHNYPYATEEISFDFVSFITTLINTAVYAIIVFAVCNIFALLLGALASIVQHAEISANIALYNAKDCSNDKLTSGGNSVENLTKT